MEALVVPITVTEEAKVVRPISPTTKALDNVPASLGRVEGFRGCRDCTGLYGSFSGTNDGGKDSAGNSPRCAKALDVVPASLGSLEGFRSCSVCIGLYGSFSGTDDGYKGGRDSAENSSSCAQHKGLAQCTSIAGKVGEFQVQSLVRKL
jgi:hypothetical protein